MSGLVQYAPWTTDIELAFYSSLANLKINHDKLDSSARKVLGLYEIQSRDPPERSTRMQIHGSALTSDEVPAGFCRAEGIIRNFNTIEEYKQVDKVAHIERAGTMIWDAIQDGSIYSCPSLLSSFTTVCFADLKKYKFNYHFAYPALHSDPPWKHASDRAQEPNSLSSTETTNLVDRVQTWKYSVDSRQHGFFLAKKVRQTGGEARSMQPEGEGAQTVESTIEAQSGEPKEDGGISWSVNSLASFETGFFDDTEPEDRYVCFVDPSTYPSNPSWPLRNLLVLIRQRFKMSDVQILCYRDTHLRREHPSSIVLHLRTEESSESPGNVKKVPKITGWERNDQNKTVPRTVDLGSYLDPARLADQAVDLNLKLIKWRIAPSIDLDIIKNTSCLLLGAGTLGSYVARNLMGWGARKITFVDNGRVSYSNPVRQPLFAFKDCLEGGSWKAERAAATLQEIYPGAESTGHIMSVPMAGHAMTDESKTKADFDKLHDLIESHDAVFLLMDTRESRWLPTVMAKPRGKIVINAALGFDTYMVMRHGVREGHPAPAARSSSLPVSRKHSASHSQGEELGCYFCNDVVAPADSLKAATLDQQCTVTRPGVAPIASALAVELLVSILQSPLRARAFAPAQGTATQSLPTVDEDEDAHPLGTVPHQLRGFLSNWTTLSVRGQAYDCCSACSPTILREYETKGWEFVKRAIAEKGYVEDISGLAEVQRRAEEMDKEVDWDEDDDELEEIM